MYGSFDRRARGAGAVLATIMLLLTTACAEPSAEPNSVAINTGMIGRVMPGAYFVLSWPMAEHLCRARNGTAEIQDVKNGVAAYRCVDGEASR
jgi:hypothetical protein